jgi:hypothetical protein
MDDRETSFARAYAEGCLTIETDLRAPMSTDGASAVMTALSVYAVMNGDPGNRSEEAILRHATDMASRPTVQAEINRLLKGHLRITWPEPEKVSHAAA